MVGPEMRAARTQRARRVKRFRHPAAAVPKLLDRRRPLRAWNISGNSAPEPAIELLDREFRRRHVIHDPAPCSRRSCGSDTMATCALAKSARKRRNRRTRTHERPCRDRRRRRRFVADPVARGHRRRRRAHAQPAAGAQQPVGSAARGARRRAHRHRRTTAACARSCSPPTVRRFPPATTSRSSTARRADPDRGRAYFKHIMTTCSAMMQQIVHLPQPVIAAVQAIATAAGCQLVASCDLAVASRTAQVRHARRQYRPVLLDADGRAVAQRFAQARDGNAADRRDDHRRATPRASVWSIAWSRPAPNATKRSSSRSTIAAKSALTVKIGKEAFYRQLEMPLAEAYRLRRQR